MKFIKNTYICDNNYDDVFVIEIHRYNTKGREINGKIINEYINTNKLKDFKIKEKSIIFYIKLDQKLLGERQKIIDGKYSSLLDEYKNEILKFVFINGQDDMTLYTKVYGILTKNEKYKEAVLEKLGMKLSDVPESIELRSKINIKEETYCGEEG